MFDPTSLDIGLTPTTTTRKAVPRPLHTSWQFSSEKLSGNLLDVGKVASALVANLEPHVEKIRDAVQAFKLEAILQVVLTISPNEELFLPILGFDQRVIAFLGYIGGTIDVDLYHGAS